MARIRRMTACSFLNSAIPGRRVPPDFDMGDFMFRSWTLVLKNSSTLRVHSAAGTYLHVCQLFFLRIQLLSEALLADLSRLALGTHRVEAIAARGQYQCETLLFGRILLTQLRVSSTYRAHQTAQSSARARGGAAHRRCVRLALRRSSSPMICVMPCSACASRSLCVASSAFAAFSCFAAS